MYIKYQALSWNADSRFKFWLKNFWTLNLKISKCVPVNKEEKLTVIERENASSVQHSRRQHQGNKALSSRGKIIKFTYKYDLDMVSAFVTLLNIGESLRYFTLIHQQSLYRRMRVLGSRVWFIGLSLIHLMLLRLLPLGKNYISSDLFHKVNSVMCDDMSFLVFKPNYRICTCTGRLKRVPVILLSRAL